MNIGLIGGIGPHSTSIAIKQLSKLYLNKFSNLPCLTVRYIDGIKFIKEIKLSNNLKLLIDNFDAIEKHCDYLTIFCNSAHIYRQNLIDIYPSKFFDLTDCVVKELNRKYKNKSIGILGTNIAVNNKIYTGQSDINEYDLIHPPNDLQDSLNDFILSPENFFPSKTNLENFKPLRKKLISYFNKQKCTHLLIACTDLDEFVYSIQSPFIQISTRNLFINQILALYK